MTATRSKSVGVDKLVDVDACLRAAFAFPGDAGAKWALLAVALHQTGRSLEVSYDSRHGRDIAVVSSCLT